MLHVADIVNIDDYLINSLTLELGCGMVGVKEGPMGRRKSMSAMPYLVLTSLLYGKFKWLRRPIPGCVSIDILPASKHLGVDRKSILTWLDWLENMELIRGYVNIKGVAEISTQPPPDMEIRTYIPPSEGVEGERL